MLTKIMEGWWLDLSLIEQLIITDEEAVYALKSCQLHYNCSIESGKLLENKLSKFYGIPMEQPNE